MHKEEAKKEIERLRALIAHHNKLYFEEANPVISDYEYDQLVERLAHLEQQFPSLKQETSPTEKVGEAPSKNFPTVYHQYPMLSLSNTYSPSEVAKFVQRVEKHYPRELITYFCELKFDGIAISALYENGKLAKIVTRGDGEKGDDITQNANLITGIPETLSPDLTFPKQFEVRGEVFMSLAVFEALNQQRKKQGYPLLANPRNATAGALKTIKKTGLQRQLSCYMYTLLAPHLALPTHEACIQWLIGHDFPVSPTYQKCHGFSEIIDYINYWEKAKTHLPIAIDGVVIKVNDKQQQKQLGATTKSPRWAIAYKYTPENLATILENVDYQVGRTGVITPVAQLQPILLAGTVVRRATLHNASEIERLQLHEGDTVFIEKGGEIIPKITGVDMSKRLPNSLPILFITNCPACGNSLIKKYEKGILYCPNVSGCPSQLQASLIHFVSRKAMDIRTIGPKTISLLLAKRLLHDAADLYALNYEDFKRLDGFQERATQHVLSGIAASKQRPFERVLFALGIRHVGEIVAEKLVAVYQDIDALMQASMAELMDIPCIGEEIANSIVLYFQIPEHRMLIIRLKNAGLQFTKNTTTENKIQPSKRFENKFFLISGTFQHFEREALKETIKVHGGRIATQVSKHLDFLVVGNKPGPAKLIQAEKLGIAIINENQFLKMLSL